MDQSASPGDALGARKSVEINRDNSGQTRLGICRVLAPQGILQPFLLRMPGNLEPVKPGTWEALA